MPDLSDRRVFIKRDDLAGGDYSGNKRRKLKHNLRFMQSQGIKTIVSVGGPFSNHLYAVASLARSHGLRAILYVRGTTTDPHNPVLRHARHCGAQLHALTRDAYAGRNTPDFVASLMASHPDAHFVPEGGTNELAIGGCAEIVDEVGQQLGFLPDYWIVPGGTGGTAAGVAEGLAGRARLIVALAVQKPLFEPTFRQAMGYTSAADASKITIEERFHFGGLAKWDASLIASIRRVARNLHIELDPLYTGKAWFAMEALIREGTIAANASILFLHTGGQAGTECFRYRFGSVL